MFNVGLLGGISFVVNGVVVGSDIGRSGRLLASYLFEFPDRVHRRERLIDLFWGELEPDKARSAFNTALWRIRKLLDRDRSVGGRRLVTIGSEIVLEHSGTFSVDTHALQAAARLISDIAGDELSLRQEAQIAEVSERYGGPFLDGEEGDWILQERERLHCLFVRSTLVLMRRSACRGNYEHALEYGRRILAADPLREGVQRQVMLLLVLNGQRVEAIRIYRGLEVILMDDLGIRPMPETSQLAEEIVSGKIFKHLSECIQLYFSDSQGFA